MQLKHKGALAAAVVGILAIAGAVWAQDLVVQGKAAIGTTTTPGAGDPALTVAGKITADSLGAGGVGYHRRVTGRYYTMPQTGTALTACAPAINTLWAIPFVAERKISLDTIAFNVTTAGGTGSKARVGIYSDSGNLNPSTLLVDGLGVTTTTTGVKSATISVTLDPGVYWLVYSAGTAAPTIRCLAAGSVVPVLGVGASLPTSPGAGWSVASTYGALPATFPTGASVFLASSTIPGVFVQVSEHP